MIHATNPDDNLPAEGGSPRRAQLVDDLRLIHQPTLQLSRVDDAVMRTLQAGPQEVAAIRRPSHRLRLRLGVPLAAVLVVAVGLGSYVHQQMPTAVSAQTILRHAETAGLVPEQATHFIYQITASTGYSSTVQFWEQVAADGAVRGRADLDTSTPPSLLPMMTNELYRQHPSLLTGSWFKGQETLGGVTVDVVQLPPISGPPPPNGPTPNVARLTLYIDAQSYITRGYDWTITGGPLAGSTWQMRLVRYETVPASSVPWSGHGSPATSGTALRNSR